jgi:hypothetical protein
MQNEFRWTKKTTHLKQNKKTAYSQSLQRIEYFFKCTDIILQTTVPACTSPDILPSEKVLNFWRNKSEFILIKKNFGVYKGTREVLLGKKGLCVQYACAYYSGQ